MRRQQGSTKRSLRPCSFLFKLKIFFWCNRASTPAHVNSRSVALPLQRAVLTVFPPLSHCAPKTPPLLRGGGRPAGGVSMPHDGIHSIFGMARRFRATHAGFHPVFGMARRVSHAATCSRGISSGCRMPGSESLAHVSATETPPRRIVVPINPENWGGPHSNVPQG